MAIQKIKQLTGFKRFLFKLLNVEKKAKNQFENVLQKVMQTDKAVIRYRFVKINAKWLRETYFYDVSKYLRQVNCPTLVISGEKDIQLDPNSAFKIGELLKGPKECYIIPNMNHLLRTYEGQHHLLTLMKEYRKCVNQPLSDTLIRKLVQWLNEQQKTNS